MVFHGDDFWNGSMHAHSGVKDQNANIVPISVGSWSCTREYQNCLVFRFRYMLSKLFYDCSWNNVRLKNNLINVVFNGLLLNINNTALSDRTKQHFLDISYFQKSSCSTLYIHIVQWNRFSYHRYLNEIFPSNLHTISHTLSNSYEFRVNV